MCSGEMQSNVDAMIMDDGIHVYMMSNFDTGCQIITHCISKITPLFTPLYCTEELCKDVW